MIVYIEGVDGSGKSILANQLTDFLKSKQFKVYRNGESLISTRPNHPKRVSHETLFDRLTRMANSDIIYILDRGPVSDCVYRCIDEYQPVTMLSSVYEWLRRYRAKVFGIYCKTLHSEQDMLERGDDNLNAISCHPILERIYDTIIPLSSFAGFDWYLYDWTVYGSLHSLCGSVLRNLGGGLK